MSCFRFTLNDAPFAGGAACPENKRIIAEFRWTRDVFICQPRHRILQILVLAVGYRLDGMLPARFFSQ
jgi:hypothetical protein